MKNVYEKFGLEPGTQDFIGHAMALYLDDEWATSVYTRRRSLIAISVTSTSLRARPMSASCFILLPWRVTASHLTYTRFMASASYPRHLRVSPQFTVAPTCSTNRSTRLSPTKTANLLAFAVVLKLSRLSKSLATRATSVPAVRAERSAS